MSSKKMRVVGLVMAVTLVMLALAACSGKSGGNEASGAPSGTASGEPGGESEIKQVTFSFLSAWNGGGALFPQDQENNPLAQRVKEMTGVSLKMESITTNETEKLNMIFASGTVPDIVSAPFWSSTSGEGQVIKKAAMEGQLLDLTPYLDKYPNVKRLVTTGIAKDFAEFDLNFGGKYFVIPMGTPDGTPESTPNWNYGLYARGDILKSLNVKAEEIDTQEELYDLLVKIKDGGFKDIAGKPVIPAGTMHDGWDYTQFLPQWSDYSISDFREEDGKLTYYTLSKDEEQKLMYMRKLLKDGLFDLEAFSNTDTMATEKLTTGKLAVFGAKSMLDKLPNTLYKTNPEMQYELLGPMKNKSGQIATQVEKKGATGSAVIFLSAKIKDPEAALRYIDYLNSDEGRLLSFWGIEGTHYQLANGMPQWIPDVKQKFDDNADLKRDEALNFYSVYFIGAFSANVAWPKSDDQKTEWEKLEESFSKRMPIHFIDKISATYLEREWSGYEKFREDTGILKYDDEFEKALYAKTDEDALKILHAIQQKYRDAGAEEMAAFVAQKAAERDDVAY